MINSTFWPLVGGPESIMRYHAELFASSGHQVCVICGHGQSSHETYQTQTIKELSPGFPLNLATKLAVDHGQTDKNLQQFSKLLIDTLTPYYDAADVVFTHGALTTHFNLALTQAIWTLADLKPTVAWVHDFTATNKNYSLPNPTHMPWSLMRKAHPKVTYVAVSQNRQKEISETLSLPLDSIPVIDNGVPFQELMEIQPEFYDWLMRHDYLSRDIVFYYPTKIMQRKNIDKSIMFMDEIKKAGFNPMLLITGSQDVYGTAGVNYETYLRSLPQKLKLEKNIFYLNDYNDEIGQVWAQAFRVSDVLLFPSSYEGQGIPPLEAVLSRLPCWAQKLPAYEEWQLPTMTIVTKPAEAVTAAKALMENPTHIARKKILRDHRWTNIYLKKIQPLLNQLTS